jgi:uncharacterized membrane protein YeaQ/YmgE (transglycosylase-associated protein family)
MLGFMWWLIIGLVAGLLARLLVPGRQPMGWLLTIGLGLLGSIVGGMISSVLFGTDSQDRGIQTSGLIMSTVGAVIVLSLYLMVAKRNAPTIP